MAQAVEGEVGVDGPEWRVAPLQLAAAGVQQAQRQLWSAAGQPDGVRVPADQDLQVPIGFRFAQAGQDPCGQTRQVATQAPGAGAGTPLPLGWGSVGLTKVSRITNQTTPAVISIIPEVAQSVRP